MLIENYIKRALQEHFTIFKTRFEVLNHLFAVNGNGLEFKDGFLDETHEILPTNVALEHVDALYNEYKSRSPAMPLIWTDTLDVEHKETIARLQDINLLYNTHPAMDELPMMSFNEGERYTPMYEFRDSLYEDLIPQLEYFRDCILAGIVPKKDECESDSELYHARSLVSWKKNISQVDDFIEEMRKGH